MTSKNPDNNSLSSSSQFPLDTSFKYCETVISFKLFFTCNAFGTTFFDLKTQKRFSKQSWVNRDVKRNLKPLSFKKISWICSIDVVARIDPLWEGFHSVFAKINKKNAVNYNLSLFPWFINKNYTNIIKL